MSDHQGGQQNPADLTDSQDGRPNQPLPNNMPPPGDEGDQPGPQQDQPPPQAYPGFQPPRPNWVSPWQKEGSAADVYKGCGIALLIIVAFLAFAVASCFGILR